MRRCVHDRVLRNPKVSGFPSSFNRILSYLFPEMTGRSLLEKVEKK